MARFWKGGHCMGGFCEKALGAASMSRESVSTCSRMDFPLAKARPRLSSLVAPLPQCISERMKIAAGQLRESNEKMWAKQPCRDWAWCRRRGRRCSWCWGKDSLQPLVQSTVNQAVPLLPMEIHPQPVENPPAEQLDASWKKTPPVETPARRSPMAGTEEKPTQGHAFWQDPPSNGRLTLEQPIPEGLSPVKRTCTGAGLEAEENLEGFHEETPCWDRASIFNFVLIAHYSSLLQVFGIKLNHFPELSLFYLWFKLLSDLPVIISSLKLFIILSAPFYWKRRVIEWVGRHLVASQGYPTATIKFIKISKNSKYRDKNCTYFILQVEQKKQLLKYMNPGAFCFGLLIYFSAQMCSKIL